MKCIENILIYHLLWIQIKKSCAFFRASVTLTRIFCQTLKLYVIFGIIRIIIISIGVKASAEIPILALLVFNTNDHQASKTSDVGCCI
jgi:hypothetical protein